MEIKNSYYVKRDGVCIWLSPFLEPKDGDKILEIRKVLIADEEKILSRNGEIIGCLVWIEDENEINNFQEVDMPAEKDEVGGKDVSGEPKIKEDV